MIVTRKNFVKFDKSSLCCTLVRRRMRHHRHDNAILMICGKMLSRVDLRFPSDTSAAAIKLYP